MYEYEATGDPCGCLWSNVTGEPTAYCTLHDPRAAESCGHHYPARCPQGCDYRGDRYSRRQIVAQRLTGRM